MALLKHAETTVQQAERQAMGGASLSEVLTTLRGLSMEEFGELLFSLPDPRYPAVSAMLPAMASRDTQERWTGGHGLDLLARTAAFVRQAQYTYAGVRGETLQGKTILDFGCGYGRFMRLMYYFTNPESIWGVDAWEQSLDESRKVGVLGHLVRSERVPTSLPVGDTRFDLGYAFSVFTHLSPRAAGAALDAIRGCMSPGGVFIATIRPIEFWSYLDTALGTNHTEAMEQQHEVEGFAHVNDGDPESEYGESSIRFDYFDRPGWKVVSYDWTRIDSYQIAVALEAV